MMFFTRVALAAACVCSLSEAAKLDKRGNTMVTAKFDEIPNGAAIQNPYENMLWDKFFVTSPDRSQPSYVEAPSPFQYARILSSTAGKIHRGSTVTDFLIPTLKYACSVPNGGELVNPGPPMACTITITETCETASDSRNLVVHYNPTMSIAPMQSLNLRPGRKCQKAVSYTFSSSSSADILLDGVALNENRS